MGYIRTLKHQLKEYSELIKVLPDKSDSSFELADQKLEQKLTRRIEKKIAELYELIIINKQYIIPMEILAKLSKISDLDLHINETLKAKYMALILREYRKFKEVSAIRDQKQMAMQQLQSIKQDLQQMSPILE